MSRALIIGTVEKAALAVLRELAAANPINIDQLKAVLKLPAGKTAHMRQMNRQTVEIPMGFVVALSIEIGHPFGTGRHMSVSVDSRSKVPHPAAVGMIAEELGFVGFPAHCHIWPEQMEHRGAAINVLQPLYPTTSEQAQ